MVSKTPKFDVLLDKILDNLIPHERSCEDCKKEFSIGKEDISLLKMLRVPAPRFCPDCRQMRRLAFANYSNIYKRKCDVPGHDHTMISPVPPVIPWIAYDYETYYSDAWDPKSYGKEIDTEGDFLSQFKELLKVVPHRGVPRGADSPNSDFSFYGKGMKDCYYVFGGRRSEDIMYSASIYDSKHIVDSYFLRSVDSAYQNIITNDCFKTKYVYFSSDCIESDFMYDCRNCQNCFGCVNLRNKNYCWFNEELSREEYLKRRRQVDLGSRVTLQEYKDKFWAFVKENPIRATRIVKSENSIGNDIQESKNVYGLYQADNCENVRYSAFAVMKLKDSMDVSHSGTSEKLYNCQNVATKCFNIKFSLAVKESIDCEYMMYSHNCQNCFGCIGLKNSSYMIFNKQYEKEEYFKIVDEIKSKILVEGNYGDFLPMAFSPVAYNSSLAQIMYPMTERDVVARGLYWQPETDVDTVSLKTILVSDLPDNISEAREELCNLAIVTKGSQKPFRITKRELEFYKINSIALPSESPNQRMLERFRIMNNFQVTEENCDLCGKMIKSAYRKSDGYKPYCSECYKKTFL